MIVKIGTTEINDPPVRNLKFRNFRAILRLNSKIYGMEKQLQIDNPKYALQLLSEAFFPLNEPYRSKKLKSNFPCQSPMWDALGHLVGLKVSADNITNFF